MFDSDQWKRMRSDHSLELSIFHVDRYMTWRQVKKMSSSLFSISAWSTSHYFFKHYSHDSQTEIDYSTWYLFINYLMTLSMWWRCFSISTQSMIANLTITCSYNSQTLHLSCLMLNIFSSFTDIDMSLIFFVDRLWLLGKMLSRRWKLCTIDFSAHATF